MSNLALAFRQLRYENKIFWRNPAAAFFTFIFPLMFLVIFNLIFGGEGETTSRFNGPREVSLSTFYVPAVVAFGVISACYTNIAIGLVFSRDEGQLKRTRGTPLPAWIYLFGRIAQAIVVAVILVIIVVSFGRLFYDVELPGQTVGAFIVSLAVGAACFSALGIAVTAIVPNPDAAPAVINGTILPLLFISDVFIPIDQAPDWLVTFANIFPVKHLSNSLVSTYNPFATGSGFVKDDLIVMGAWAIVGILVSFRFFSWEPRVG
jgi:ABC-2 type transport system permease protein